MDKKEIKKLTKELAMQVEEFKRLSARLEEYKASNIDPNDPVLLDLKEKFIKNNEAIKEIETKLQEMEEESNKK